MRTAHLLGGSFLLFVLVTGGNAAASTPQNNLFEMSLEQLLEIKVISVDKALKSLEDTPAAMYVVTRDDIRASGAETIADALRLVPGLHVGQVTASSLAVGARGLNGRYNNKFLILIDGRSAFSQLYNGISWDAADVPLEQIERIEIVRGPGGSLWESKAMNGIVNVITQNSRATIGTTVQGEAGNEHRAGALIQHGAELGEGVTLRAWGAYDEWDGLALPAGDSVRDGYKQERGGFRLDWQVADNQTFMLSGDLFTRDVDDSVPLVDLTAPGLRRLDTSGEEHDGGSLLGRWDWQRGAGETVSLQGYYSHAKVSSALLDYTCDTIDVELNHQLPVGDRNTVNWGAGFRYLYDDTEGQNGLHYDPDDYDFKAYSLYLQDEFAAVPDKLFLTFGVKAEHNSYTDWEFQPTARLLWKAAPGHNLWGAVSRTVRTPSRSDVAIDMIATAYPGFLPTVVNALGNPDIDAEKAVTWEAGYRTVPNTWSSLDLTVYYTRYDDLIRNIPGTPYRQMAPAPPRVVLPVLFENSLEGDSTGFEIALKLEPANWWRINLNYTWQNTNLDEKQRGSRASTSQEASFPEHQANLLANFKLNEKWQLGTVLRYVGKVEESGIPAYVEGDLNLFWQPSKNLDMTVSVRNLFDAQHPEYPKAAFADVPLEVERSVVAKVTWKF